MSQFKVKRSIRAVVRAAEFKKRAERAAIFTDMLAGKVATVAIIQERGTGKILAVGTNMENAVKALNVRIDPPADFDIQDFVVTH